VLQCCSRRRYCQALISCATGAPTSVRPADVASLRAVTMVTGVASIRQGAEAGSAPLSHAAAAAAAATTPPRR